MAHGAVLQICLLYVCDHHCHPLSRRETYHLGQIVACNVQMVQDAVLQMDDWDACMSCVCSLNLRNTSDL